MSGAHYGPASMSMADSEVDTLLDSGYTPDGDRTLHALLERSTQSINLLGPHCN
jgi:hypothetical protein